MGSARRTYRILNYVWLEGLQPYVFGADNKAYPFNSLEIAVAELQDDFDTWAHEVELGEREPEYSWAADEFLIRCIETDELIPVDIVDGRVCALPPTADRYPKHKNLK